MKKIMHAYDITHETDMVEPLDYNRRSRLKEVDRSFKAEITNIIRLTDMEKLFQIRMVNDDDWKRFSFLPGQFVMLELPGYGEIPISFSSSPSIKSTIELCIRRAGKVTEALHKAKRGAIVGLRGPFGTYFPMEQMKGNNILLIAGGLGLAPLRAPISFVIENRADFQDIYILYGAKNPAQLLFDYQYDQWHRIDDITLEVIVEEPDKNWIGPVGMITKLLDDITVPADETYAIVCGPPVMFKFVCNRLNAMGIPMQRMFVSLERRMHCGIGKCCRCNIGSSYTCIDGPVFDFWTVMNLKEAI
ncbi:MAG: FAD/NAD(P)-binding protein [Desulfosalsimonadaceae bacterium]|nr:FAD/NAD(P)-binding protein [Desulfosalsimonadaceae bacterium]